MYHPILSWCQLPKEQTPLLVHPVYMWLSTTFLNNAELNLTSSILKRFPMFCCKPCKINAYWSLQYDKLKVQHFSTTECISSKSNWKPPSSSGAVLKFFFNQNKLQIELCKLPLQVCPVGCSRTNSVSVTLNSTLGTCIVRNISRLAKSGLHRCRGT